VEQAERFHQAARIAGSVALLLDPAYRLLLFFLVPRQLLHALLYLLHPCGRRHSSLLLEILKNLKRPADMLVSNPELIFHRRSSTIKKVFKASNLNWNHARHSCSPGAARSNHARKSR
jgi:hypothetical protein